MDKNNRFYLALLFWFCSAFAIAGAQEPLRVVTEHLPPYQIVSDNRLVAGTSYLLMKEVLKRAGYPVQIEVLPWARAYQTALAVKNVVIFSMTRSREREALFHWIGELRTLNYTFYSVKGNIDVRMNSIEQALHYTVVAARNSVEADILQQQGFKHGKNLILTAGYLQAWQLLLQGHADITYANELIGDSIHTSLGKEFPSFVKQPYAGMQPVLYVAANKTTDAEIINRLSRALLAVKKDGTFDKILSRQLHIP
ncbi:transporter substrate-binding domain-containing protein [Thalassomonas viridans]|uniref:Transporter substrate-binding domain-containing protein n=1 Tax=Thalassomonas viridans TaxID=137584 RepID=A0AAF0C9H1_9GAMM|nr:transporter substrate-binding domain-containing protein [Thalassomonas viridans]WDE05758.1 transporter substrate-binding domain-containing protein [Thalassomonas viridans]